MLQELILNDFYNNLGSIPQKDVLDRFRQAAETEATQNNGSDKFQKLYKAALQNPKYITKLFNIREEAREEAKKDPDKAAIVNIQLDDKGNHYAKIIKAMEGGYFDFSIHDGKVVFNGKIGDNKMSEVLYFLFRRGITDFELPQGVDENFAQTYKEEYAKRKTTNEANVAENSFSTDIKYEEVDDKKITPKKWDEENKDENISDFYKSTKHMEDWLGDKNQKKKSELSFFQRSKIFGDRSVEFSVYNSEDPNNLKNDGNIDKKGVKKETCAYRVKLIPNKNKELSRIEFHIPNDGKCPDPLADELVALVKSQGATYMNFPEGLAPSDAKVFHLATARAGIIPTGISINKNRAKEMEKEAENNIQKESDLYSYKGKLGRQLLRLCKNDPKDPRFDVAVSLINQEKLFPLKQQLEGCLTGKLTERIEKGKAEEVIGAAQTMKQIATTIFANPDLSIEQLCQNLSPQDSAFQAELLEKLQKAGASDKTASKLDDEQMLTLFSALETKNIEKTKNELNKKIARNKGKDSEDTIVEREVNSASKALNVTLNKMLRDKGFSGGFATIDFGTPTFEPNQSAINTTSMRRNNYSR